VKAIGFKGFKEEKLTYNAHLKKIKRRIKNVKTHHNPINKLL
jgi:hypothetical protein